MSGMAPNLNDSPEELARKRQARRDYFAGKRTDRSTDFSTEGSES